jgi:hypothetical protein
MRNFLTAFLHPIKFYVFLCALLLQEQAYYLRMMSQFFVWLKGCMGMMMYAIDDSDDFPVK